jgi:hypothetical protein
MKIFETILKFAHITQKINPKTLLNALSQIILYIGRLIITDFAFSRRQRVKSEFLLSKNLALDVVKGLGERDTRRV